MIKKLATLKRAINSIPDDSDLLVRSGDDEWLVKSIEITNGVVVIHLK
jgi:regulation of enolase protein 1 (concanavalin A-like superfamily)